MISLKYVLAIQFLIFFAAGVEREVAAVLIRGVHAIQIFFVGFLYIEVGTIIGIQFVKI